MAKPAPEAPVADTVETVATRQMVIAGIEFTVSLPYAEGHTVSAIEARVLNQTRSENISNGMRKKIEELRDVAGEPDAEGKTSMIGYSAEALEKAAALVAEYDASYTFASPSAGPRKTVDPLERMALTIARAHVTALIKQKGLKVKDVDAAKIEENVEKFAVHPTILELARKRLAESNELALGLDL